jgi:hypothetical protein
MSWVGVMQPLPKRSSPLPFGGDVCAVTSAFGLALTTLKKGRNKHLSNSSRCIFIELVKFDFDSTLYAVGVYVGVQG